MENNLLLYILSIVCSIGGAFVTSLVTIKIGLARIEERQTNMKNEMDSMKCQNDKENETINLIFAKVNQINIDIAVIKTKLEK